MTNMICYFVHECEYACFLITVSVKFFLNSFNFLFYLISTFNWIQQKKSIW